MTYLKSKIQGSHSSSTEDSSILDFKLCCWVNRSSSFEGSLLGPLRSEDEGTTILWNAGNFYLMTRYSNTPEYLNLHFYGHFYE